MAGRGAEPVTPYDRAAGPVLDWAETLPRLRNADPRTVLDEAAARLDRFSEALRHASVPAASVAPARYALALIIDAQLRANRRIEARNWSAAAHRLLFDGREMSPATIRDLMDRARSAGAEFEPVLRFLESCLARIEGARRHFDRKIGPGWAGITAVLVLGFCCAMLAWIGWVEYRFHRELSRVFAAERLTIGLDREGTIPDLAPRLDRLSTTVRRVASEAEHAPIRLFADPLGFDAVASAGNDYDAAVQRHLPFLLAQRIDAAIATEGEPVLLYDDLRAWSILAGQSDWSPAYLAGWIEDREGAALSEHVAWLRPPETPLPRPDADLMEQARHIATEADEVERAYLELRRSAGIAAIPGWQADAAVPGLSSLLHRRSGLSMDAPLPALFTVAGWDHARDIGAGSAVQVARAEAAALFPTPPANHNDTPDRLLDRLQRDTVAAWRSYLTDLQVQPFSDPDRAVLISGQLSRAASPLDALLRAVWAEAGGLDRRRSHDQQLAVATAFAPMIQYLEQGRMRDISDLFAGLNVALGAMDRDAETGLQRLMSAQDRAASIAALRQAPPVVVGIVEDVLAQTSAAHADLLTNPLTRAWQAEVLPACRDLEARFPFAEGPDADPTMVTRLLAPGGAIDRYLRSRAAPYLDMTGPEWRWKPEARFSGLAPESAIFLQRASVISAAFYGPDGTLGTDLGLAALAERGKAFMAIGGTGGAVEATGDALDLHWPGPDPAKGAEVSFQTAEGAARIAEPGPWGLLRLLAPLRLRERDGGQRILVDLREGGARLFLEITFDRPGNPVSRHSILSGFVCPQVL